MYILNRSPTSSVQGLVPKEVWSGQKVFVLHFQVFCCITFAHVLEELRKKLDCKSEKHNFIEYVPNLNHTYCIILLLISLHKLRCYIYGRQIMEIHTCTNHFLC